MTDNAQRLAEFMRRVWNEGDTSAVPHFLAEQYTIHSDPGDAWEGQTLSREGFVNRLTASRGAFPDLFFDVSDTIAGPDSVAIAWRMRGTNSAPMGGQPASGRTIDVAGMTIYYFHDGMITGHRQVVDRLTAARQLGLAG